MSLTLLCGDATTNHLTTCINEAKAWLRDEKNQTYMIVPNNIKFEMEFEALNEWDKESDIKATTRLQVLSFSRLAWTLLGNDYYEQQPLSTSGVMMLVRRLLKDNKDKLQSFRKDYHKVKFSEQLTKTLLELKQGGITPEMMLDFMQASSCDEQINDVTLQRLHDLQLIYPLFLEATSMYMTDNRQMMETLTEVLKKQTLTNTQFIIYGFHHFNSEELLLLSTLMQQTQVIVSLVMPSHIEKEQMFYSTEQTKNALLRVAYDHRVNVEQKQAPSSSSSLPWHKKMNFFFRSAYNHEVLTTESLHDDHLLLYECDQRQTEVEQVAREIIRLVNEEGYRYRDITIMTRDLANYSRLIQPLFDRYHLPYNISNSQKMNHHPLVDALETLFDLVNHPTRQTSIIRLLKTELFVPRHDCDEEMTEEDAFYQWQDEVRTYRNQVDHLDRLIQRSSYQGYEWYPSSKTGEYRPFVWRGIEVNEEKNSHLLIYMHDAETIRQFIIPIIQEFQEIVEHAETGTQLLYDLYAFLIKHGVLFELQQWQKQAITNGQIEEGRRHEQTWQSFVALLDEFNQTQGMFEVEWDIFEETFLLGMQESTYSTVPSTMDQINVVDVVRQRAHHTPIVFIMGCQDGIFPSQVMNNGMMDDQTITSLNDYCQQQDSCIYIGVNEETMIHNETYYAYKASLFATTYCYFTYSKYDEDGKETILSPFLQNMVAAGLRHRTIHSQPSYMVYDHSYISKKAPTMALIIRLLRQAKDQYAFDEQHEPMIHPVWKEIAQYLMTENPLFKRLYDSLVYQNKPALLTEATSEALYKAKEQRVDDQLKKVMDVSVSKIETFYQCQYRYFLQYGLFLREEEEYTLDARLKGTFNHEVIEQVMCRVQEKLLNQQKTMNELRSLSSNDITTLTNEVMGYLLQTEQYSLFHQDGYMEYMKKVMGDDLRHLILALSDMTDCYHDFVATAQELHYGKHGLKPLSLSVNDEWQMLISGKIDRIDFMRNENGEASFAILDYKSKAKTVDMNDIYEGLALQLLTYIDIALHNKDRLMNDYFDQQSNELAFGLTGLLPIKNEKPEYKAGKTYHVKDFYPLSGFYSTDHAPEHIDDYFKGKKDKTALTDEQMTQLLSNNEQLYQKAAQTLVSGEIEMNPYFSQNKTGCQYCPFQSICQFDSRLDENQYRRLRRDISTVDDLIDCIEEEKKK